MAVNLRGRVEGCGEDLAGNYESGITFVGREDVEVPALVRKSLLNNRLRRVSDPEMPLAPHKPRKMPTRLAVFEKILGICTNWSSFFLPPQLGDSELLLHLPVYDLLRWPNLSLYHGMPVAIIFRATAERTGVAVFGFPDVVGPRLAMEGSLPGAPLPITTV